MRSHLIDPTAEKDDQMPLTPEERKVVGRAGLVMFLILMVAGIIIYTML